MKKVIAILVATLVLALPLVTSDSATMSVAVGSSAPTVTNLVINSQDAGASVNPTAGTTTSVSLSAEVNDNNGYADISSVICTITGPGTVGASPLTLAAGSGSGTTNTYTGSFDMDFYDVAGTYTVNCTATDLAAGTGSKDEDFAYQPSTALELDATDVDFSSMNPLDTTTVTGDTTMVVGDTAPTIQNYGNTQINAQYSASGDLTGTATPIAISNAKVQFTALGFNALDTTPATETGLNLVAGASSTTNVDFQLYVPAGTVSGSYGASVTITAI